jgi:hypothetical protein
VQLCAECSCGKCAVIVKSNWGVISGCVYLTVLVTCSVHGNITELRFSLPCLQKLTTCSCLQPDTDTVQKPSLRLYFSQNHQVAVPIFCSVISLDKFENICRSLHCTDNTSRDTFEGRQKVFKTYQQSLNLKFQTLYVPK